MRLLKIVEGSNMAKPVSSQFLANCVTSAGHLWNQINVIVEQRQKAESLHELHEYVLGMFGIF